MNKYQIEKENARDRAIWQQHWLATAIEPMSWLEYTNYCNKMEKLGRRYGLLKEFRENGIC